MKLLLLAVALVLVSCSSSSKSKNTFTNLVHLAEKEPSLHQITAKYDRYLKMAEKLKKFHDSGEMSTGDVMDVLKSGGIVGAKAPTKTATRSGVNHPVSDVPPPVNDYHGQYRWPLDAGIVSSEFGHRWGKNHEGIDIAADQGEPVKASADGVVMYAAATMRGYGNALIIRHDAQVTTLYAHNKGLLARVGDKVKQGQVVALLGSTGHSTGPHVHFEYRIGSLPLNPREKLAKARF